MSYENNGQNVNYEINEYGEIVRKDYAFRSAKNSPNQPLPTNRSLGMVLFLSIITLGIYGIVLSFNMAGETNISCEEDGKHTPGFWQAVLLSLITLGIYGFYWNYNWCNREAEFLRKYRSEPFITGGALVAYQIAMQILNIVMRFCSTYSRYDSTYAVAYLVMSIVMFVLAIIILKKELAQHNAVNKLSNLRRFPSKG